MAANDRLPPELDCSNLGKEWPTWRRVFLMYMMASGKNLEAEPKKIATFLWLIGVQGMEIYNNLFPNDGTSAGMVGEIPVAENAVQQRTLEIVLAAFDGFCIPKQNSTMESFKFNNIMQKEKQRFADFETALRKQIQYCNYKCTCGQAYEERMLMDRIIIGVQDKKLQLKLLESAGENLKTVLDKCKAWEAASLNKSLLDQGVIHNLKHVEELSSDVHAISRKCYNCGASYTMGHKNECRAKSIKCYGCGKTGHFAKYCRRKSSSDHESESKGPKQTVKSLDWVYEE